MIREALDEALCAMDPRKLVADALASLPKTPRRVIAIGKASPAMAAGARDVLGDQITGLFVVAPEGTEGDGVFHAAHPLPDERSIEAGERILAMDGPLLVLMSGGASALACAPAEGISLNDLRDVTKALLASGATIQMTNTVRKHVSRLKGGALLRRDAEVLTLVLSDVINGQPSDVGSGPSVPDPTTVEEARAILEEFAPKFAELPLVETFKEQRGTTIVLGSPEQFAERMTQALAKRGVNARTLKPSQAPVETLAAEYALLSRTMRKGMAVVRAAEPRVVLPKDHGRGGRASHLAAMVARDLPSDVVFLAFATDGIDGGSGTAGAVVQGTLDGADVAVSRYDTAPFLEKAGAAFPARPTAQNLTDLHVLYRA